MNELIFSPIGYTSLILSIGVLLFWLLHLIIRPRRWLCHIALVLAIVGFVCAKINSTTYVNRLQLDRTDEMAALEAEQQAKRQAAEDLRKSEVAQIRFAEDG
ncbi:MAG: hypothetical protein AAF492_15850, partial [Verrucomicrobiota bacterium]